MMNLLMLALAVQDAPYRAQMTIERFVKREDGVTVQSGTLSVRPGEALAFDSRPLRIWIRGGKAVERRAGSGSPVAGTCRSPRTSSRSISGG